MRRATTRSGGVIRASSRCAEGDRGSENRGGGEDAEARQRRASVEQACKPDSVWGDHLSWQQPGPSAGRLVAGPVCLAPDGVWRAAVSPRRWWALTPPFHPYLRGLARSVAGGLLSVPLSVGFRRLGLPSVLPFGVRPFLV